MKTITYICIFALAILTSNCSKDDDSSEAPIGDLETLILGSWKMESKTVNGEALELFCGNGLSSVYTFNETDYSYDVDINDGNDCVTIPYTANYSIDGNTITIMPPLGDNQTFTVTTINETTLIFTYSSSDDEEEVYIETYQKI